jgi:hypothetical protein
MLFIPPGEPWLAATVLVESLLRLRAPVARAHGDEVPTRISWSFTG